MSEFKFDLSKLSIDDKFKLICLCGALMHFTFLVAFVIFGFYFMAAFNVLSVTLYICCAISCFRGTVGKHASGWINAVFTEIVIHAFLCTIIQGLDTGFYVYYIMTVPIASYCLFFYEDRKLIYKRIFAYTAVVIVMLGISVAFDVMFGSVYKILGRDSITQLHINVFSSINIFFTFTALCAFTLLFCMEIYAAITKLNEKNDELEFIAEHDALTGLYNRHALWDYFDGLSKNGKSFCVILGDIDDFKKVNDTYGHDCGDLVLKCVAGTILDEVGEEDIAVRWGGEEMLIILLGSKNECILRTEKIRKHINELKIVHNGINVKVSMTFGLVDFSELNIRTEAVHSSTYMDSLISIADKRLYDGKNSGKNKVVA